MENINYETNCIQNILKNSDNSLIKDNDRRIEIIAILVSCIFRMNSFVLVDQHIDHLSAEIRRIS